MKTASLHNNPIRRTGTACHPRVTTNPLVVGGTAVVGAEMVRCVGDVRIEGALVTTGALTVGSIDTATIDHAGSISIGPTSCTSLLLGNAGITTVVVGNLTISGTTTTVNSTVVDIADRVVHLNHSTGANTGVPTLVSGLGIHRGAVAGVDRDHAGLFWDEPNSRWNFALNTGGDDLTVGADQAVKLGALTVTSNLGQSGGTVSLAATGAASLNATTTLGVGTNAASQTITIGNRTGTTGISLLAGSGNFGIGLIGSDTPLIKVATMHATTTWNLAGSNSTNADATLNHVRRFGWNVAGGGGPVVAGQPVFSDALESHYQSGGNYYFERHWEYVGDDGVTTRRLLSTTVDQVTHAGATRINGQFVVGNSTGVTEHLNFQDAADGVTVNAIWTKTLHLINNNNVTAMSQLNAALNAYVHLIGLDASDRVTLAGAGTTTLLGGALVGSAGTYALTLGSMTGDTTLPTGACSWSGAAGKAFTVGAAGSTGTITVGQGTSTNAINVGCGAIAGGQTQTINVGVTTSTGVTAINYGSAQSNSNIHTWTVGGPSTMALTNANPYLLLKANTGATQLSMLRLEDSSSNVGYTDVDWYSTGGAFSMGTLGFTNGASYTNTVMRLRTADASKVLQTRLTIDKNGSWVATQGPAAGATSPIGFKFVQGAHTTLTNADFNAVMIDGSTNAAQFSGAVTLGSCWPGLNITATTLTSDTATKTVTLAATLNVAGAPVASTNIAAFSVGAASGSYAANFGAAIRVAGGIYCRANTGIFNTDSSGNGVIFQQGSGTMHQFSGTGTTTTLRYVMALELSANTLLPVTDNTSSIGSTAKRFTSLTGVLLVGSTTSSAVDPVLKCEGTAASATAAPALEFRNSNPNTAQARLWAKPGTSYVNPVFGIDVDNGSATPTTRLTIDKDGLASWVGIQAVKSHALFAASDAVTLTSGISTADATVTTIKTLAIADNSTYWVVIRVTARGTAGTKRAVYMRSCLVYREAAGVATLGGLGVQDDFTDETTAAWDLTVAVDGGNNLLVRGTGEAATAINWVCTIEYQAASGSA